MRSILLFLLLVSGHLLLAQTNGKYLIRAGHLFDSENGRFVEAMTILVDGNKIVAVKPSKEVSEQEEKDYQLIDLSQYTVLPGLIDAHTHLLYKEIIYPENKFDGLDLARTLTMDGDAYRAIYGAARAKAYLEAGIGRVAPAKACHPRAARFPD
jgi:imidazolonepropionase-like amidohydrolase